MPKDNLVIINTGEIVVLMVEHDGRLWVPLGHLGNEMGYRWSQLHAHVTRVYGILEMQTLEIQDRQNPGSWPCVLATRLGEFLFSIPFCPPGKGFAVLERYKSKWHGAWLQFLAMRADSQDAKLARGEAADSMRYGVAGPGAGLLATHAAESRWKIGGKRISPELIKDMAGLLEKGLSQKKVAATLRVSAAMVNQVIQGKYRMDAACTAAWIEHFSNKQPKEGRSEPV